MQPLMPSMHKIVTSKPKLLIVISAIVVAALSIPVILPHLNHPAMIYHIVVHVISFIVSLFLGAISAIAYRRTGNNRILFMFLGFLSLSVVELIFLFDATGDISEIALPLIHIELPHIILLAMVALFGIGVLKVNK
jgi:tellurite resistance protein TehA-like permease